MSRTDKLSNVGMSWLRSGAVVLVSIITAVIIGGVIEMRWSYAE